MFFFFFFFFSSRRRHTRFDCDWSSDVCSSDLQKAGKGYADPEYDLSVEWSGTRARLKSADAKRREPGTRSRVLLIIGSARNDGTCPGEVSKTFRLTKIARKVFEDARFDVDTLDLSLLTSEYGKRIYPCKGCVATAMALCH